MTSSDSIAALKRKIAARAKRDQPTDRLRARLAALVAGATGPSNAAERENPALARHDSNGHASATAPFDAAGEAPDTAALPPAALRIPDDLPIAAHADALIDAIRRHRVLVVAGETGSGKTTQLAKLALAAGRGRAGRIGHTQPRRIAARSIANRIAAELAGSGADPAIVGHRLRFEDHTTAATRIKLMTDGILLAEASRDRRLSEYDTIILDEVHERSLNIDFLLGLLKNLLKRRADLHLILTSATLDAARLSAFFNDAPCFVIEGRSHPVEIIYRPPRESNAGEPKRGRGSHDQNDSNDIDPLTRELIATVDDCVGPNGLQGGGDVLVFLPGEAEIREAHRLLRRRHAGRLEVLPLYARLPTKEQARVFQSGRHQRVVLATNVAETALTVPGIRVVIDTGLARITRYSWRSRIERLALEPIAQDAAIQRAGRCGRIGPGTCVRLYSEADFRARPAHGDPEILRSNLAHVLLAMRWMRLPEPQRFEFLDPPENRAWRDAEKLLLEIGALDSHGRLSARGRRMARLPLDPSLAATLDAATDRQSLRALLTIVAFLGVQDPRERPPQARGEADAAHDEWRVGHSDFLGILKLWMAWHSAREDLGSAAFARWCHSHFLHAGRLREWATLRRELAALLERLGTDHNHDTPSNPPTNASPSQAADSNDRLTDDFSPALERAIHSALIEGFASQLAQREAQQDARRSTPRGQDSSPRRRPRARYRSTRNRSLTLHPSSALSRKPPAWIVAADIVETHEVHARIAGRIESAWIVAAIPHLLKRERLEPHFEPRSGRVLVRERLLYHGLLVDQGQTRSLAHYDPAASRDRFIRDGLARLPLAVEALVDASLGLAPDLAATDDEAAPQSGGAGESQIRWQSKSRVMRANAAWLESEAELAVRSRRPERVPTEDMLYLHYAACVPDTITDGPSFEHWLRSLERRNDPAARDTLDRLSLATGLCSAPLASLFDESNITTHDGSIERTSHAAVKTPTNHTHPPHSHDNGRTTLNHAPDDRTSSTTRTDHDPHSAAHTASTSTRAARPSRAAPPCAESASTGSSHKRPRDGTTRDEAHGHSTPLGDLRAKLRTATGGPATTDLAAALAAAVDAAAQPPAKSAATEATHDDVARARKATAARPSTPSRSAATSATAAPKTATPPDPREASAEPTINANDFPDRLKIGARELPLRYRFKPGADDDGVTLHIPLGLLRGLPDHAGDWLVPGLLEARAVGLIKTLPKALRRHLVPAPDIAKRALALVDLATQTNSKPFLAVYAASLSRIGGVTVTPSDFQLENLDTHLAMRFQVLDRDGNPLIASRDLAALKRRFRDSVEAHFAAKSAAELRRSGITRWDFGTLPERIELEEHGARIPVVPVLIDEGDAVRLDVEPDPRQARNLLIRGLSRLIILHLKRDIRDIARQLPEIGASEIRLRGLLGRDPALPLRDQIMLATCRTLLYRDTPRDTPQAPASRANETDTLFDPPRDAQALAARLEMRRHELTPTAFTLATHVAAILERAQPLVLRLNQSRPLHWVEPGRDIDAQLARLLSEDFAWSTPPERLSDLPRYLEAIDHRLDRLDHDPEKDRRARSAIEAIEADLFDLLNEFPDEPDLVELRWQSEELRVATFAPGMRVRGKVSVARIDQGIESLLTRLDRAGRLSRDKRAGLRRTRSARNRD
ncbi:MAG: DUF3418 domain-containing protein [Thioalkalivibrionaceae bacterium]